MGEVKVDKSQDSSGQNPPLTKTDYNPHEPKTNCQEELQSKSSIPLEEDEEFKESSTTYRLIGNEKNEPNDEESETLLRSVTP